MAGNNPIEEKTAVRQHKYTNTPKSLKEEIHFDFLKCYEEVSGDEESSDSDRIEDTRTPEKKPKSNGPSLSELASEVDRYATTPTLEKCKDPLSFWKEEKSVYPTIAKVARRYRSCPASSVYSERLFSEAGKVLEEHRALLLPRNGEQLLLFYIKCQSSYILVSYWLNEYHVTVTNFNC